MQTSDPDSTFIIQAPRVRGSVMESNEKLPRPSNFTKMSGKKMFEMLRVKRPEQKVIIEAADIIYKRYNLGSYGMTYQQLKSNEPDVVSKAKNDMYQECRNWKDFVERCEDDEWITDVLWTNKTRHILDRIDSDAREDNRAWKEMQRSTSSEA